MILKILNFNKDCEHFTSTPILFTKIIKETYECHADYWKISVIKNIIYNLYKSGAPGPNAIHKNGIRQLNNYLAQLNINLSTFHKTIFSLFFLK